MLRTTMLAASLIGAALPAASAQNIALSPYDAMTQVYACAGGTAVQAAYLNLPDGLSLAVIDFGEGLTVLEIAVSASGARYVTPAGTGPRRVWWTRGATAFLQEGEDGREEMVLEECVAQTP